MEMAVQRYDVSSHSAYFRAPRPRKPGACVRTVGGAFFRDSAGPAADLPDF